MACREAVETFGVEGRMERELDMRPGTKVPFLDGMDFGKGIDTLQLIPRGIPVTSELYQAIWKGGAS